MLVQMFLMSRAEVIRKGRYSRPMELPSENFLFLDAQATAAVDRG